MKHDQKNLEKFGSLDMHEDRETFRQTNK